MEPTSPSLLPNAVAVRGAELRRLRRERFKSAEAFAEACGSVSLPTVYRAERGGPVQRSYLARMARELGIDPAALTQSESSSNRIAGENTMTGEWLGLFVEADRLGNPYIAEEDIRLTQDGQDVAGTAAVRSPGFANRAERFTQAQFKDNIFFGQTHPDEWPFPLDCGAFVLSGSRNINWLQGFVTWFDCDSEVPEVSRFFLLRKGHDGFEDDLTDAKRILNTEIRLFRIRKFLELGYQLDTAVELLQTAEADLTT